MDPEFPENTLGMMTSSVSADPQGVGDGGVGPSLRQERGNFELPWSKSVSVLQVCQTSWSRSGGTAVTPLFLRLRSQLPHLSHRFTQLSDQLPAVSLEIGERGKKIVKTIVRGSSSAVWTSFVPFVFLHDT